MPECPYCGRWFRSKKGLRIHIARKHTYKLPTGERVLDPFSFDILGAIERREERRRRRLKRRGLFDPW